MAINMEPDGAQLLDLWAACAKWIGEFRPLCAESIVQTDRVNLNLDQLGEAVCEVVGYADE